MMLEMDDGPPDEATARTPPHSLEAERSVLGSVFIKPSVWHGVSSSLETDDFFLPAHREIFEAMLALDKRSQALDPIAVADELKVRGQLGKLEGGEAYLGVLMNAVPTAENAAHYTRLVREKATLRRLIAACAEVQSSAYGDFGEFDAFTQEATRKVAAAAVRDAGDKPETLAETYQALWEDAEKVERGEMVHRIPTGNTRVDALLSGGLAPEHLVCTVGLTSMGKTSWALGVAVHAAAALGLPSLIFSLEMSRREVLVKIAALLMKQSTERFALPAPGQRPDWEALRGAGQRVSDVSKLITVREDRSLGRIIAAAHMWRAQHRGRALVVVDYLQRVQGIRRKGDSREQEVFSVATGLKSLAKDLKLPVIAPCTLDNDSAKEKRAPRIGDMRESKGIEYEADVILALHRERLQELGKAEIIALKHRGGRIGKRTAMWVGAYQAFENVEDHEVPADDE